MNHSNDRPDEPRGGELPELIGALLDGVATPGQQDWLNELLASDAEARATYRRYVNLHVTLRTYGTAIATEGSDREAGSPAAPVLSRTSAAWWRRGRMRAAAALGAGVAAAVLLAVFLRPTQPAGQPAQVATASAEVVARFTRVTGAKLASAAGPVSVGDDVKPGTLDLRQGFAEITLTNGVRMVLEAPVTVDLPRTGVARLRSGRLVATVPENARGFAVDTPRARVVDLGTEFGVGVREGGDTEVQVFRGLVVASWQGPGGRTLDEQLDAGKAVSIGTAPQSPPRGIPFEPERFVRMFPTDNDGGQPGGPVYSRSRFDAVHVVPPPGSVKVDGDLSDWDRSGAFYSACLPPYHDSHYVEGMMMYDRDYLYIAAHVGDPAPMRSTMDPGAGSDQYAWRGGSVIVRLSSDPKLGWPLTGFGPAEADSTRPDAGTRPQDVSDRIVHDDDVVPPPQRQGAAAPVVRHGLPRRKDRPAGLGGGVPDGPQRPGIHAGIRDPVVAA